MRMREFFRSNKVIVAYLFLGICTTFINIGIYYVCTHFLNFSMTTGTGIAWAIAVLFSYFSNKRYVFHSQTKEKGTVLLQIFSFFVMRLGTGIFDWLFMFVFVELLCFHDMICKTLSNLIVIVLNFAASKFVIFKG